MKIVYLHQYFRTPEMSGGTRSFEMAKRFAAAGHEVHVVTSDTESATGTDWTVEDVHGFRVHWLPVPYENAMTYRRRLRAFAAFAWRASMRARRLRPDLVFATSTPLTIVIPALFATAMRKTRYVFEVRDLWPEVPIALGVLKGRLSRHLARVLERLAYKRAAAVIALSEDMAAGVRKVAPERCVTVVPNSCDLELFRVPPEQGELFRASRTWLGSRPLIVYAGTLGRVNGVGYMVELATEYSRLDPTARFLIVGSGAEAPKIRALAEERGVLDANLFMEEPIPKAQMPALLSAADLSCSWVIPVPALEANSANKFFDTLAAGRPIAINHGGWQAEVISAHKLGLVLDARDFRRAARQLHEFLSDESRQRTAKSSSRHLSEVEFSRDALAGRLLSVLESVHRDRGTLEVSSVVN